MVFLAFYEVAQGGTREVTPIAPPPFRRVVLMREYFLAKYSGTGAFPHYFLTDHLRMSMKSLLCFY